jgi:hypothetical protein
MAKKKATKKAAPTRAAKPKAVTRPTQSKRKAEAVLTRGPLRRRVQQPTALPGMEHLGQITALDDLCRSIKRHRDELAELREYEAGDLQAALNIMRRENRHAYRQHGIELARVPGEEKLRVRKTSEGASSTTDDEVDDEVFAADAEAATAAE